ncbi:MAG: redox-sensing transcriptional repressor Rex [Ruminococcus sp.]|nr:redox-sensing transcriptional repressor Rex [Ruminococcus sp.]
MDRISSGKLAELMNSNASQIRQDLNCFGGFGQQGYGYIVSDLKEEIAKIIGIDRVKNAVICGFGNLGKAIYRHFDDNKYGFELVGLFDSDKLKQGQTVGKLTIQSEKNIIDFCKANNVETAIICVPTKFAEGVVDLLYEGGVRSFWNFSHFKVHSKYSDVIEENVHLSESLLTLSYLIDN